MIPLALMAIAWLAFRLAGLAAPLRDALAAMFVFTAVSHFAPRTRADLIRMVPPAFPAPALLVTLTGIVELAGAAGLMVPSLARPSAYALMALLIAMFPANVFAARRALTIGGRPATPLAVRLPMQVFWIAALWFSVR
jgi:uncharacterized membrane protein